jgi:hypothetical protein
MISFHLILHQQEHHNYGDVLHSYGLKLDFAVIEVALFTVEDVSFKSLKSEIRQSSYILILRWFPGGKGTLVVPYATLL